MTSLVRRARDEDAPVLRALRLEALRDTPEAFGSTYDESRAFDDDHWLLAVREWNYFLGFLDARAAGMASGGRHDAFPGTCWLFGMYVAPASRGLGLAEALVDRVSEWARAEGADSLYLHVTESVDRARAFYRRAGFVETGESHAMTRDPTLRLLTMVRHLD